MATISWLLCPKSYVDTLQQIDYGTWRCHTVEPSVAQCGSTRPCRKDNQSDVVTKGVCVPLVSKHLNWGTVLILAFAALPLGKGLTHFWRKLSLQLTSLQTQGVFAVLLNSGLICSSFHMNFKLMGIFVKDIALIWEQKELPSHKGSWEIEKNRC